MYERLKNFFIKTGPSVDLYEEGAKCFQNLSELQKKIRMADLVYIRVSVIEGKTHSNGLYRLEEATAAYKIEYERCEKYIKPK